MSISTSRVAAGSLRVIPRKPLSRAIGALARISARGPLLDAAIDAYCRAYGVSLDEYVVPPGGFGSFDAFFTRQLKPGSRPLDADIHAVLSPADGRIADLGPIDADAHLLVKGAKYTAAELIGDEVAAAELAGGYFAIVYLSPRDYHRVHAPVTGPVRLARHVAGTLFPVNDIGVRHIPRLFARNERVTVVQDSVQHGPVYSVLVGAIGVGRISLGFDSQIVTNDGPNHGVRRYGNGHAVELTRGGELGMFHLGSTVILFVGPRAACVPMVAAGATVQMGEAIFRRAGG
jgi:phosphatidylserine decarboxylase